MKRRNDCDFLSSCRERAEKEKSCQQIILPKEEYAMVMHEFNTNMSDEDRKCHVVTKAIQDHYYVIINNGFDNYTVIGKYEIPEYSSRDWEEVE